MVGYDPLLPDERWPRTAERVADIDSLLGVSDCVTLHLPLTAGTSQLLDRRRLALLPPGAVVVNVSRGELIDEPALLDALSSGRLRGAACDVLTHEPPAANDPMLASPDVLLTPHVAFLSASSLRRYAEAPARNVLALLADGAPLTPLVSPTPPGGRSAP